MAGTKIPFKAARISDRVYWVGAIDWKIRDFHGYATDRGTTYNAFLILGEKPILVDTVKHAFGDEMLARIASVIPPESIDCIISNHSEMDHTGCLPKVIDAVRPRKVFASAMGVKTLSAYFGLGESVEVVKDGAEMTLGGVKLVFLETRMLHWPDSMFTYLPDDGILFSQDAFGMHLASSERFDDELPQGLLEHEAEKYYANILLPFSPFVSKVLERAGGLGPAPRILAPDHGPIWRKAPEGIMGLYGKWASQRPSRKAVIIYDTMWGSTEKMASAIAEGLAAGGSNVKLMPLGVSHRSDVATEVLEAGALIVGTPTLNNNIFPTVADVLTYLKGLRPKNLVGAAFGSHGWSGEGVKLVNGMLAGMKVDLVGEGVRTLYLASDEVIGQCFSLGGLIAGRLKESCAAD